MSVEVKTIYPNININKNGTEQISQDLETAKEISQDLEIAKEIQCLEGGKKSEIFIPRLRYYAVGPENRHIKCPLCGVRDETYFATPISLKNKTFEILSCFSFCIPICWIPFGLLCISAWNRRRRQFCSNCGAQMGYYFRPS